MQLESKYRPIPFWSWNEKLDTATTADQVRMMAKAGMGGFFMHARGGLLTPYMEEEWFANVDAAITEAEAQGLDAWAYDENGWPSGFGDGAVNGMGIDYQQKYLRIEQGEKQTERTIANAGGYHLYYDVNELYVDTLYRPATDLFIKRVYKTYSKRCGKRLKGIFTDEPQISRNGIPWSLSLPPEYEKRYGETIYAKLPLLFYPLPGHEEFRVRFWQIVTDLFSANFMKPIYDYCHTEGLELTGHLVLEETLLAQLTSNGAAMPHYEYFDMPGMDWLGRHITPCLTPRQVSSVAQQLGKGQVLSETFALCGHNMSFEEMRGIYEWQMVRGITLLCTHLEGYSLRGLRKRDYPPALFYQQPWWEHFDLFTKAMSFTGKLLSEGKPLVSTLVLHPQTTAWILFDCAQNKGLMQYHEKLLAVQKRLEEAHVEFHFGDETILARHARVENGKLVVGQMTYDTVILPPHLRFLESTGALLAEYARQGGRIVDAADPETFPVQASPVIDNPNITCTTRALPEGTLYYFVNSTTQDQRAQIACGTCVIDPLTGEKQPLNRAHTFAPYTSLLVLEETGKQYSALPPAKKAPVIDLSGAWQLTRCEENTLMLDRASYWFDGSLVADNGWVIDIQDKACDLKRPVDIRLEYRFTAESVPDGLHLLCETPEIYEITVNGKPLDKMDLGWHRDTSFRKLSLEGLVVPGENVIGMTTRFTQPDAVYECIEKSRIFESEKNKLSYPMEIEPVMLLGHFAVRTPGTFLALDKDASRYQGPFVVSAQVPQEVDLKNIERQGFPFFSGKMTLKKTITLEKPEGRIRLTKHGLNVIRVRANGGAWCTLPWNPYECDLSRSLAAGPNDIEIELTGNLRNLLGPHHLEEGECYFVRPGNFFRSPSVWNGGNPLPWNDDYCFVDVSVQSNMD